MDKDTFFGDPDMIGKQRFFRNVLPAKKAAGGFAEFAKKIVGLDCISVPMPKEEKSQNSNTVCHGLFFDTRKWFY